MFSRGYINIIFDNITLKIISYLKSTCPKMVELTLWSNF